MSIPQIVDVGGLMFSMRELGDHVEVTVKAPSSPVSFDHPAVQLVSKILSNVFDIEPIAPLSHDGEVLLRLKPPDVKDKILKKPKATNIPPALLAEPLPLTDRMVETKPNLKSKLDIKALVGLMTDLGDKFQTKEQATQELSNIVAAEERRAKLSEIGQRDQAEAKALHQEAIRHSQGIEHMLPALIFSLAKSRVTLSMLDDHFFDAMIITLGSKQAERVKLPKEKSITNDEFAQSCAKALADTCGKELARLGIEVTDLNELQNNFRIDIGRVLQQREKGEGRQQAG